ncbi:MAG: flagellar hook-length control protein FliK [Lachnospiraceae bacterium]|nr:flagellar hook-length control protein FliK [Lachnospiraceae bacterium]
MGTNAINNLMNDLNLINVEIPKNADTNDGFQKSFEEASQNSDIAKLAQRPVDVVDELKSDNAAKDEYIKESSYSSPNKNINNADKTDSVNAKTDKKTDLKDEEEVDYENAANALVANLADILNVSVEELEEYISDKDLTIADLSNNEIIQQMVVDFTEVENPIDIISDSEAYEIYTSIQESISEFKQFALDNDIDLETNVIPEKTDALFSDVKTEDLDVLKETDLEVVKEDLADDNQADLKNIDNKDSKKDTDNDSSNNLLANNGSNVNELNANELSSAHETPAAYTDINAQDIYDQIGEYIRNLSSENIQEIEMKLQPETLGTIQVKVTQSEGVMKAEFVTTNESVKAMLEGQLIQLKEDFERSGLKVDDVEVRVNTNAFNESTDSDSRDDANEAAQRMSAPRRINLAGLDSLDELEEMEEEERVVAEMMTANGNSLDYKA